MAERNQTPEQAARDKIDQFLESAGWKVQKKKNIDLDAGLGVAIGEYDTDAWPTASVLSIDPAMSGVQAA